MNGRDYWDRYMKMGKREILKTAESKVVEQNDFSRLFQNRKNWRQICKKIPSIQLYNLQPAKVKEIKN